MEQLKTKLNLYSELRHMLEQNSKTRSDDKCVSSTCRENSLSVDFDLTA